jgi:TldD protein
MTCVLFIVFCYSLNQMGLAMNNSAWQHTLMDRLQGEIALRKAFSRGGDLGELYYEESSVTSLVLEDGRLEKVITGTDAGISIRAVFDNRQAFAAGNVLTPSALVDMAGTVAAAVDKGQELNSLAVKDGPIGPAFLPKVSPDTVDTTAKAEMIRRAEKVARQYDPRVRQVRVVYGDRAQKVAVLSASGRLATDERVSVLFMVQVVASDGDRLQVGYEPVGAAMGMELLDENSPEEIARRAAERAIMMLTARESPAGPMPVVLSSRAGGTMVHEAIGHGLEADLAGEGLSVYAGRIGETVASSLITVIDDSTLPYRRGSFAADDEGSPAQRTVLVDKGVLKSYMYDCQTAFKAGVESTGNGRRESYRHKPVVRMTNTYIGPGDTDPDDILASTKDGLLVYKMGGGQVNTVNGDFVFEVSEGYLIENGKKGEPVRGATLTGNGPGILKRIDMVGNDLGFDIGTCGKDGQGVPVSSAQPTLRIPEIVVGGRRE